MEIVPDLSKIREAHHRILSQIHVTPVLTCESLNELAGADLFFKCENMQKVGAFKFRGASNAVITLSRKDAASGVVTHSSGNHAAALALAAKRRGINAHIVMPRNAPAVKIAAVKNYGGMITFCEPTLEARENTADAIIADTGAVFIHPYNDYRIIAGQGTAALEFLDVVEDLDYLLAPVGGGGLLSGTAISAKSIQSSIQVIGCEPQNADDAYHSYKTGKIVPSVNPDTIADGLKTSLGDKTFAIIRKYVDDIVLVQEQEIVTAMQLIYERMKIVVEPSSSVVLAAALCGRLNISGKKVGLILSGGNVDMSHFFSSLLD
ncbi:MAG: pyridoxal-phosphate dependent enzyme [candidate division KSB1 bacterium]|jgi:threonine dehydratase|nr:pyridoxal-phosphate dependent enzyme [candidate division KSB1 bacterium]